MDDGGDVREGRAAMMAESCVRLVSGVMRVGAALVVCVVGAVAGAQEDAGAKSDRRCMQCHGQEHIATLSALDRRSMVGTLLDAEGAGGGAAALVPLKGDEPATRPGLLVKPDALVGSTHAGLHCIECHTDAAALPHAAVLNRATCAASCHAEQAKAFGEGAHFEALKRNDPLAPTCASCHGGHDVLKVTDRRAASSKLKSLHLCGDCHAKHLPVEGSLDSSARVSDYLGSTHARAVEKAGLPMAASCADCHGAHGVKPSKDPSSPVNRANVPGTCGKCHVGVVEEYDASVHGRKHAEANEKAAVCTDCHTAHQITHAGAPGFMTDVINECGRCHDSEDATGERVGTYYQSYAASYHGQVTRLGGKRAARCADCHGAHNIHPLDDPRSQVSSENLVGTCAKCHPGANANFVKFDPHANHRDAKNYPVLHGVWLYFMIMMSAVFTFFGVHTVLWFIRAKRERARMGAHVHAAGHGGTAIRRFTTLDRVNHAFVALTFFGLTATGIPLVFADAAWAGIVAKLLGGIEAAGIWHRFFAILLILNFGLHFAGLGVRFMKRKTGAIEWLFGPNSLMPRWKDVKDVLGMIRWFFGRGKPPRLDRWTYWEKFDYWAEVGGSMIIGGSGLLLWFPEIASKVLPGWLFNVAMIVHGYEALLAIGFIFTIHFFNAHLRPGTFPVDAVIFTGSMPEEELKEQRPEEYERLVRTGGLESLRVQAPDPAKRPAILVIAVVSVGFGLLLLGLILAGGLL
jgi:cytochrome b subunit of formate dehydrogenase